MTPYFRELVFRSWQREKNRKFRNWYEEEKKGFARSLIEGYQRVLKHFASASFGLEPVDAFRALDPSFVIFHEIKETLKDRGIAGQDQLHRKLGEFLHSDTFEDAPFIKISAMLWAAMARKAASGRKKPPNRGFATDVNIISALLPYCNAMFVDNECNGFLKEKPLADEIRYGTKVFSYKSRKQFLEYLDKIKSTASRTHLEKVKEVYGDDWMQPYTDIYKPK